MALTATELARRDRKRGHARRHKVAQRVASASSEMAVGITEGAAAAQQLVTAMAQIARGGQLAAAAAQQSLAAVSQMAILFTQAREKAGLSQRKAEGLQALLAESGMQVAGSIASIKRTADQQAVMTARIRELETHAADIGKVVETVAYLADQTNMLSLNAAIEATRAGTTGAGFAVIADEVRILAETSEKNAQRVGGLVAEIRSEVTSITDGITQAAAVARQQAQNAGGVTSHLDEIRRTFTTIADGARAITVSSEEAERAAHEVQRAVQHVATAAEEQSAATEQSMRGLSEQSQALSQAETASQELASLTESLRTGEAAERNVEEVATISEELSATVQQLSGTAAQIMTAIAQISRGTHQQASASQECSAALAEMERNARQVEDTTRNAIARGTQMSALLAESDSAIRELITGVETTLEKGRASAVQLAALERLGRQIEKMVNAINTVSIQTTMLAISGAVEAARAGEAGQGFATVAADIRTLSREGDTHIEAIRDTVRDMQDQMLLVRRDLAALDVSVATDVQRNQAILPVLASIAADIQALNADNEEVNRGAAAILKSVLECSRGMEDIATAAEEASRATSEAAAAGRQQAQGVEDLAAAAEEIALLADELLRSGE
ncbi:methyl-accepting chemotaxis protein [Niveispirillum sp. KHB5.9]|uniref:methyl-accepting chemotaxis protein n=1 Tax=Niveispirillum sp. KHB5.9 TaxID=3400269 RepID=UPI003A8C0184